MADELLPSGAIIHIENLEVLDKHKHHSAHKPPTLEELLAALLERRRR
jgi:hypothetical protein